MTSKPSLMTSSKAHGVASARISQEPSSVEAEIIRALPDIARAIETWLFDGASDEDAIKPILAAMAEQRSALRQCQSALAMMINPDRITGTTILTAFATATAAEAKARELLGDD